MTAKLSALADHIKSQLGPAVLSSKITVGELTLDVERGSIAKVLTFLRDDVKCLFEVLIDLCGVDYPERRERFDVVYHLLSPRLNQRIRIKVATDEDTPVASVIPVFPAANWYEREAFDMYGILFSDHPDLRRLLTDYGFQAIRCARTSRSRALWKSATTMRPSAWSMSP